MKTLAVLTLSCLSTLALSACGDDSCESSTCEGNGTGADATATTTAQGSPTTSTTDTTSTNAGAGGDGGSSVSTSTNVGPGGSGGAGSTGTGGAPPGCELVEGNEIAADCGIFVNADAAEDGQNGSQTAPYTTIGQAIDAANTGDTIYVCDSPTGYDESLVIDKRLTLVGGLGCASWKWAEAGRSEWRAESNFIPLTVDTTAPVALSNFDIAASDSSLPGQSSVAVFAISATLDIQRCELSAGRGADGQDRVIDMPLDAAPSGSPGTMGCGGLTDPITGGAGGQNICEGSQRHGGRGGQGTPDPLGGNASSGSPIATGGAAGLGEGSGPGNQCSNGGPGDDGSPGTPGAGATSSDEGALTASGFTPASGTTGTPGTPGSGGGGGGGANLCTGAGPSGGGGGAGGCGGDIGAPGGGAGASAPIIAFESNLTLRSTVLVSSDGGIGGSGAPGQPGQPGGGGADQGLGGGACPGGNGGTGGQGGSAGGGRGGHSVGVLYTGNAPDVDDSVTFDKGTPGLGGNGGVGDDASNEASDGDAGSNVDMLGL